MCSCKDLEGSGNACVMHLEVRSLNLGLKIFSEDFHNCYQSLLSTDGTVLIPWDSYHCHAYLNLFSLYMSIKLLNSVEPLQ
jgi:hypothetical protein